MSKIILITVLSVLLTAEVAVCYDRITINQFLSLVDKIALYFQEIRESVQTPNNIKPFKYRLVYETPDVRAEYNTLPQSVKALLAAYEPTTRIISTFPALNPSSSQSSKRTPSQNMTSKSPTSLETLFPTIKEEPTTAGTEFQLSQEVSAGTTKVKRSTIWGLDRISDDFTIDPTNVALRILNNDKLSIEKRTVNENRGLTDKEKLTKVINYFQRKIFTEYGIGFALYKAKLQLFKNILAEDFPSNFLERVIALKLAHVAIFARRPLRTHVNKVLAKAKRFRGGLSDPQIMDNIIVLLKAIKELPDLIKESLRG